MMDKFYIKIDKEFDLQIKQELKYIPAERMAIDSELEKNIRRLENKNDNFEKFYPFVIKFCEDKFENKKDYLNQDLIHVIYKHCDQEDDIYKSKILLHLVNYEWESRIKKKFITIGKSFFQFFCFLNLNLF